MAIFNCYVSLPEGILFLSIFGVYTLLLVEPGLVVLRGENICEAAQKGNVAAVRHFLRTDLSTLHGERSSGRRRLTLDDFG
jgi:hypothetical protein